jgi:predicted lactoylglutathione lyase
MATQLFVNLPVRDLERSMAFFSKMGFTFNPRFTDEKAACMVVGEDIYFMLLLEKFFKSFIKKEIVDSTKSSEVINALMVESRARVDEMADAAMQAGARPSGETQDHGWMYSRPFEDLDGHLWEVGWMDLDAAPPNFP